LILQRKLDNHFRDASTELTLIADDLKYENNKTDVHCKMVDKRLQSNTYIRVFCLYVIINTLVPIRGQYDKCVDLIIKTRKYKQDWKSYNLNHQHIFSKTHIKC